MMINHLSINVYLPATTPHVVACLFSPDPEERTSRRRARARRCRRCGGWAGPGRRRASSICSLFWVGRKQASDDMWCPVAYVTPDHPPVSASIEYHGVVAGGILFYCRSFFLSFFSFAKRSPRWLYRQGTFIAQMVGYRCNFNKKPS